MRARTLAAGVLAASLLVLVACGGSDDDEPPVIQEEGGGSGQIENPDASVPEAEPAAGMPDPCSLLTEAEVGDAAGSEPAERVRTQLTPTRGECAFLGDEGALAIVAVDVDPESAVMGAEAFEDAAGEVEEVEVLGEPAQWSPLLGAISTTDGERLLSVTLVITDQDPDDLREPATELAEAALGRL